LTSTNEDPPGSFGHGIAVGIAVSAALAHIVLVAIGPVWTKFYSDFQQPLPLMTRLAISVPWQLGVPVVGSIAIGALVLRRPRSPAPYIAVAGLMLVAAAGTYWFPSWPMTMLANAIK
jgi:hypothetical protein